MKAMKKFLLMLVMLVACSVNVVAQITITYTAKGDVTVDGVRYYLYEAHYFTFNYDTYDF